LHLCEVLEVLEEPARPHLPPGRVVRAPCVPHPHGRRAGGRRRRASRTLSGSIRQPPGKGANARQARKSVNEKSILAVGSSEPKTANAGHGTAEPPDRRYVAAPPTRRSRGCGAIEGRRHDLVRQRGEGARDRLGPPAGPTSSPEYQRVVCGWRNGSPSPAVVGRCSSGITARCAFSPGNSHLARSQAYLAIWPRRTR
jgi:hypothetical protein